MSRTAPDGLKRTPFAKWLTAAKVFVQTTLFGFDFFISYRTADAAGYARALSKALRHAGFDCFLDEEHYEAGHNLPWMQSQALRRTSKLLVVVSPKAHRPAQAGTDWLVAEVIEFRHLAASRGRSAAIVPIGTPTTLSAASYPGSKLLPLIPTPGAEDICIFDDAVDHNGEPSLRTTAKLKSDFRQRRRRTVRLAIAALALVAVAVASGLAIRADLSYRRELQLVLVQRLLDLSRTSTTSDHKYDERAALYARQAYLLNRDLKGPYEGQAYEAMRALLYDRTFVRHLPNPGDNERPMIQDAAISPQARWAVIYDNDDSHQPPYHDTYLPQIIWWDLTKPSKPVSQMEARVPPFRQTSLAAGDSGWAALAASSPCEVFPYDLKSGRAEKSIPIGSQACTAIAVSPADAEVAVGVGRQVMRVLAAGPQTRRASLASPGPVLALAYRRDGTGLVGVTANEVVVWTFGASKPLIVARPADQEPWRPSSLQIDAKNKRILFSTAGHFAGEEQDLTIIVDLSRSPPAVASEVNSFHGLDGRGRIVFDHYGNDRLRVEEDPDVTESEFKPIAQSVGEDVGPTSKAMFFAGSAFVQDYSAMDLVLLPQWSATGRVIAGHQIVVSGAPGDEIVWTGDYKVTTWRPRRPSDSVRLAARGLDSLCAPARDGVWATKSNPLRAVRINSRGVEAESLDLSAFHVRSLCGASDAIDTLVMPGEPAAKVLHIANGRIVAEPTPLRCGDTILVAARGGRRACSAPDGVLVWSRDASSKAELIANKYSRFGMSPDGDRLALSAGTEVHVHSLDNPRAKPRVLRGHTGELSSFGFSDDGTLLASFSLDGTIRIWPLRGPDQPWVINIGPTAWAFNPKFLDDRHLFYSASTHVYALDLDPARLADAICRRVSRNLTSEEWNVVLPDRPRARTCPSLP